MLTTLTSARLRLAPAAWDILINGQVVGSGIFGLQ